MSGNKLAAVVLLSGAAAFFSLSASCLLNWLTFEGSSSYPADASVVVPFGSGWVTLAQWNYYLSLIPSAELFVSLGMLWSILVLVLLLSFPPRFRFGKVQSTVERLSVWANGRAKVGVRFVYIILSTYLILILLTASRSFQVAGGGWLENALLRPAYYNDYGNLGLILAVFFTGLWIRSAQPWRNRFFESTSLLSVYLVMFGLSFYVASPYQLSLTVTHASNSLGWFTNYFLFYTSSTMLVGSIIGRFLPALASDVKQ